MSVDTQNTLSSDDTTQAGPQDVGRAATGGTNLISGLGGTAGFGEGIVARNDDSSSAELDITSIFADGLNFYGRTFTSLWVNNNGSVTFNGARSTFTPTVITEESNNPEITPFFADVDTRDDTVTPTEGGNSTGSNLVYWDFDTVNDRIIVTWDDVGYFSGGTDRLNAFQLVLDDRGGGNFDITFRYEDINWTTGSASGGSDGLGGTPARAGFTAGTGDPAAFFELPASGDQAGILALDEVAGNTGLIGIWEFNVREGDITISDIPALPTGGLSGWTVGDPHLSTLDGVGYSFQAAGEFVLLRDTGASGFEIQARFIPQGTAVSVTAAVSTRVGTDVVMLDGTDGTASPLLINGVRVALGDTETRDVNGGRIYRVDDTYTIVYAGADGIVNDGDSRAIVTVLDGRVDLDVRLNTELLGNLEGLLGDGDGNADNDVARADGTVLARPFAASDLYGGYLDDWRVDNAAQTLFTYDGAETLEGFYLDDFPGLVITLDMFPAAAVAAAELQAAEAGLTTGTANFQNAVMDFLLTGDTSFFTSGATVPILAGTNLEETTAPEDQDLRLGTSANDIVVTASGNQTLLGLGGDDLLNGGAGADAFDGGVGIDTVSYEGSTGSLRVDLLFSQINTFWAAGDTFAGIENLIGSQGFDNLRGTLGDNLIQGMSNVDYIFGRRGEDTLEGGVGDDVLLGGVGADVLIGGANRDRAQYSESLTAITASLTDQTLNTGESAGDTYDSIEDLAGSSFNDILFGDQSDNRLFGRDGEDMLIGRGGDDRLNGGGNRDTLVGGEGDDRLRGGSSQDTFVFDSGADVVEDWFLDNLHISTTMGAVAGLTGTQVINTFGNFVGSDYVLDFGNGNSITLLNETGTSEATLAGFIDII